MRERVYKTCIWILGIFLLVAGWIVKENVYLTATQKIFLPSALSVAVIFIRAFYLRDIEKGFRGQLAVATKIEKTLGLYEMGIYPSGWQKSGTKDGRGNFFVASYCLVYIGAGILVAAILFS
jgi:hypothetical protein